MCDYYLTHKSEKGKMQKRAAFYTNRSSNPTTTVRQNLLLELTGRTVDY